MSLFSDAVFKILYDYKALLKKHSTPAERAEKIAALGLTKSALRKVDDATLYHKVVLIHEDIEQHVNAVDSASWYSGITEFYNHLQKFLEDHIIDGKNVYHAAHKAARALIEAVQIFRLPESQLTDSVLKKAATCGHIITEHGTSEQKRIYINALETLQGQPNPFIQKQASNLLEQTLQQASVAA